MGIELIQQIVNLHYPLDKEENPLYGLHRLVSQEPFPRYAFQGDKAFACKNCVAGCCLLSPFLEVTGKELRTLVSWGAIPMKIATLRNGVGAVQEVMDPDIFSKQPKERTLLYGGNIVKGLVSDLDSGSIPPITFLGPCGCLNSRGGCPLHPKKEYPRVCDAHTPNSGGCSYGYIQKGSEAGYALERLLNLVAPTLDMIAKKFLGASRMVRSYDINGSSPY